MRTPTDDIHTNAKIILTEIGEDPELPNQPVVRAKLPPLSQVQPSFAERRTLPLNVAEAMVRSGAIDPAAVRLLQPVAIAPGLVVDAERLHWHRGMQKLVYRCPNGGIARLDRVARLLTFGGDGDGMGWCVGAVPVLSNLDDPLSSPVSRQRYQRLSIELGTTLYVYQATAADIANSADGSAGGFGQAIPEGAWIAASENGEYRLVDVQLGARAWFYSAEEALLAANAGILGEPLATTEVIEGESYDAEPRLYYWLQTSVPARMVAIPGAR